MYQKLQYGVRVRVRGAVQGTTTSVCNLLEAGCCGDDNDSIPCAVEELKKPDPDKELVAILLPRTNLDRVRIASNLCVA